MFDLLISSTEVLQPLSVVWPGGVLHATCPDTPCLLQLKSMVCGTEARDHFIGSGWKYSLQKCILRTPYLVRQPLSQRCSRIGIPAAICLVACLCLMEKSMADPMVAQAHIHWNASRTCAWLLEDLVEASGATLGCLQHEVVQSCLTSQVWIQALVHFQMTVLQCEN